MRVESWRLSSSHGPSHSHSHPARQPRGCGPGIRGQGGTLSVTCSGMLWLPLTRSRFASSRQNLKPEGKTHEAPSISTELSNSTTSHGQPTSAAEVLPARPRAWGLGTWQARGAPEGHPTGHQDDGLGFVVDMEPQRLPGMVSIPSIPPRTPCGRPEKETLVGIPQLAHLGPFGSLCWIMGSPGPRPCQELTTGWGTAGFQKHSDNPSISW